MLMRAEDLEGLPGAAMVIRGIRDAEQGIASAEALVVSVAPTRLKSLGLDVVVAAEKPEHALYERLCQDGVADPYARYNALLRELGSFMEALAVRRRSLRHAQP